MLSCSHALILDKQSPTIDGGDDFISAEAEDRHITKCTTFLSFIICSEGMSTVFDKQKIMSLTDVTNRIDISRDTKRMLDHDCLRFIRDEGFDLDRIHIECLWIDVAVDGLRSGGDDCIRHGDAGICLEDDFVVFLYSELEEAVIESGTGVVEELNSILDFEF